ncbi:MAG: DMT family transporter [Oscillospiraceae bacterium]|nr:DMT family transporter [Oscillospiraceae bacterium]
MPSANRTKGILYIICAALCFAGMSTFVRLSGDLPVFEKAFFRNFVAVFLAFFTIRRSHTPMYIGRKNLPYVLLRAMFGTIGLVANFYAIDRLNLADANMLNKLSPFFAIIFSYFLLKEKVRPIQALAVCGAFTGALLIIKPTGENLQLFPALIGLMGGTCAGAAYTFLRKATQGGAQGPVVVLFFSTFSCLAVLPLVIQDFVMPTVDQLLMLLLCGACGAGGQFSITAAYTYAPAKEISVYDYSQVIFSAIIGFFLFDQLPDHWSILGYVLIISMAILNFVYNNREK